MKLTKETCKKWYGTMHTYGKWVVIEKGKIRERSFRDPKQEWCVTGQIVIQQRVCEVCGLTEFKKVILE